MRSATRLSASALILVLATCSVSFAQQTPAYRQFSDEERSYTGQYWDQRELERSRPSPMPIVPEREYRERFKPQPPTPQQRDGEQTIEQRTRMRVRVDPNRIPYRTAGRLHFRVGTGTAHCTASYTADPNILLTAAHCVQDMNTGNWNTDFLFVQRYNSGSGRRVTTRCVAVWPEWVTGGSDRFQHDYAFFLTVEASDVGHLGMKANWSYNNWWSIGYPAAIDGGQSMQALAGTKGSVSSNVVEMIHGEPNFTFGASGGPWLGDPTEGTGMGNYSISVNSFIVQTLPGRMFGPYFTNRAFDLFRFVRNGCQ